MIKPNPDFYAIDVDERYPKLPRVQFRTSNSLQGTVISGAAGTEFSTRLDIPNGYNLSEFVSDRTASIDMRVQDNFRRLWMPDNQRIPLSHLSQNFGIGAAIKPRMNYWMMDPRPYYDGKPAKKDTQLLLDFMKTIAPDVEVWFAAMCTANWTDTVDTAGFFKELDTSEFWERFWKYGQWWAFDVNINIPAGTTGFVTTERVQGDFVVGGVTWSSGANILIDMRAGNQLEGNGITTEPTRIDLLAPINNGIVNAARWPGVYYVRNSTDFVVEAESLTPGSDVDGTLTVWGWSIWD